MLSQEELFFLFTLRYNPLQEDHHNKQSGKSIVIPPETINIALSSGIDSHYLLHAFSISRGWDPSKYRAICIDFIDSKNGVPESPKAKYIADKYDVGFECVIIDDPLADLDKLIAQVGEPRWNLYQYYLYRAAKQDTGFLLTADGADESYLGYTFRYKKYLDNIMKCKTWEDKARLYLECHANDWVIDQESLFKEGYSWQTILQYLKQYFYSYALTQFEDHLDPVIAADINGKLRYDYHPCNSKLAKYTGIDLYCPFLTRKDFEDSCKYSITDRYSYHNNLGKLPLREIIGRWDSTKRGFGFDLPTYYARKGYDRVHKKINKDSLCFNYISRDWFIKHDSDMTTPYIGKYLQIYALELYLECLEKGDGIVEECKEIIHQ